MMRTPRMAAKMCMSKAQMRLDVNRFRTPCWGAESADMLPAIRMTACGCKSSGGRLRFAAASGSAPRLAALGGSGKLVPFRSCNLSCFPQAVRLRPGYGV